MGQEQVKFNLWQLVLVFVIVILAIGYVGPAMLNRDPLWFRPFNETPQRILVYRAGQRLVLNPGDPGFDNMTQALNRTLSTIQTIDLLGTADSTIQEYRAKETAVEILYAGDVQLKSSQNVGKASAILIPLTGVHTERPILFTGLKSTPGAASPATYMAGTPVVRDLSEVRAAVDNLRF